MSKILYFKMATGVEAWEMAKGLYIMPLPLSTRLVSGDRQSIVTIGFFSWSGIYALNAIIQRHAESLLPLWAYPLLFASAISAFWPLHLPFKGCGRSNHDGLGGKTDKKC